MPISFLSTIRMESKFKKETPRSFPGVSFFELA